VYESTGFDHDAGENVLIVLAAVLARISPDPEKVDADSKQYDGQDTGRTQPECQLDSKILQHFYPGGRKGQQSRDGGKGTHDDRQRDLRGGLTDIAALQVVIIDMDGIVGSQGNEEYCNRRA